jgi:glucosamine kinase
LRQLFLGVDGGGTKCRMRLADENLKTLSEVITQSPANLQLRDGDVAYETVLGAIPQVFDKAGLDLSQAASTHACFGMAGARLKSARLDFEHRKFPFARLKVFDDVDIARSGALGGEDGAVLIIGTGSAGLGLVKGQRLQIGGWGFLVGDAMSGAILGRKLLRKSILAHEGIEPGSPLTKAVMARFENDVGKIMTWSFENPDVLADIKTPPPGSSVSSPGCTHARPTDYGQFVPLLLDYYEQGDSIAASLMEFELKSIERHVSWFTKRGVKSLAIVGGLGQRLLPMLRQRHGEIITEPKSGPLHGALILARQAFANG